jgi:hypothetical protein
LVALVLAALLNLEGTGEDELEGAGLVGRVGISARIASSLLVASSFLFGEGDL